MKKISILLLGVLITCRAPLPEYDKLKASLSGAPFVQVLDQKPFLISLRHRPDWLLADRELTALVDKGTPTLAEVQKAMTTYAGSASFVLKVGPHSSLPQSQHKATDIVNAHPDMGSFSANLHHLFYGLGDKIYLLTADKTKVPVGFYHLDRSWGIGPSNLFLISFPMQFEDKDLSQETKIEVVIQNIHPALPELRFPFPENPIRLGKYSPEQITDSLIRYQAAKQNGNENK